MKVFYGCTWCDKKELFKTPEECRAHESECLSRKKQKWIFVQPPLKPKALEVLRLRRLGIPIREIAGQIGVTRSRAYQLYEDASRRSDDDEFAGLSIRARNVLNNNNLTNKDAITQADTEGRFLKFRNCGVRTIFEIRSWLYGKDQSEQHQG